MKYFQLPLPGRWIDVVTVVMTLSNIYPANIYLFKVNNRNNRKRAKYILRTMSMASFWCFFVNFEYISEILAGMLVIKM